MKVNMSPKAIENRLKLVGELTKACLLIRRNSLNKKAEVENKSVTNNFPQLIFNKKAESSIK
jgi:hypothetical protein